MSIKNLLTLLLMSTGVLILWLVVFMPHELPFPEDSFFKTLLVCTSACYLIISIGVFKRRKWAIFPFCAVPLVMPTILLLGNYYSLDTYVADMIFSGLWFIACYVYFVHFGQKDSYK